MKTYYGGESVKGGFYFSFKEKDLVALEKEMGNLPGGPTDRYIKISLPVMLLAGPFLGLLYVMFLPFISFAMVLTVATKKAWLGIQHSGTRMLHVATASWRPGFAYFAWWKHPRSKKSETAISQEEPKATAADALGELEKEIEQKRKEGKV